ncbi:DUF1491 family protein [Ovoidimarina sediminis]|uniref:DUF1491 family protein n=1 Tax=Ovoidimarina sediminis TaxID=3079856 RepID=UPI00291335FF|nr:DUF1491 family protein [Rhodophyticola sp. MJ-SS7]MDU8943913.1 DUF1491 family protein [Rhodophyticola sp. MJ-SS7]
MSPRLTARVWIDAYLRRLSLMNIPAYITFKGDPTAGVVMVKLATLDGKATCFQRSYDLMTGERAWVVLSEGEEAEVDAAIARQRQFDRDLWVVEVEDREGRHLLNEEGLA